ncbi:hypothetical protein A9Q99_06035 [Gammaproteobacteria bacterium 45_16_T64]|nr:hypothetical protein A9Q99_06035 [Gammaproteobacteria bacterium 45_16_T64]
MKRDDVKEIIACLGGEREIYHYFKDRYCLDMLGLVMDQQKREYLTITEIKSCDLNRYIQKPNVKAMLKHCGNGRVYKSDLETLWPSELLPLVTQLTGWGDSDRGWDQTTRNQCNLVLQLNFDNKHTQDYQRLVKPDDHYGPFEYWGHPVSEGRAKTMSWVRMDINFDTNEVLIEEIQNDWLRKAHSMFGYIKKGLKKRPDVKPSYFCSEIMGGFEDLECYVETVLAPYQKTWAEASMMAAIRFIRYTLGIDNIYYHSFSTGNKIKQICGDPPKSMYTTLPKQFGFELTEHAPEFLMQDKRARRYIKAIDNSQWHKLAA